MATETEGLKFFLSFILTDLNFNLYSHIWLVAVELKPITIDDRCSYEFVAETGRQEKGKVPCLHASYHSGWVGGKAWISIPSLGLTVFQRGAYRKTLQCDWLPVC